MNRDGAPSLGRIGESMHAWVKYSVLTLILLCAGSVRENLVYSRERGPSTPEERAKAVQIARDLEVDPLGANAKEERNWIMTWLIQVPDLSVKFCTDLLGPRPNPQSPYWAGISTQMLFSSAAFIIENPKKAKDQQAVYLAGVDGALRSYEAILKKDPQVRWPSVEGIIELRNRGKLDDYVRQAMKKCK
jgi:hypothetical protein